MIVYFEKILILKAEHLEKSELEQSYAYEIKKMNTYESFHKNCLACKTYKQLYLYPDV